MNIKQIMLLGLLASASASPVAQEALPQTETFLAQFRERTGPPELEFSQFEAVTSAQWASAGLGSADQQVERTAKLKERRTEIKVLYEGSLKEVSKKPAAARLLKEYYVQWQSTMDSMDPKPTESKMSYNLRIGESVRRVNEAWYRFEAEL